jgi:hypothetical protein
VAVGINEAAQWFAVFTVPVYFTRSSALAIFGPPSLLLTLVQAKGNTLYINLRDVFITELSRLSMITVETVKVVWIAIDVASVSSPPRGLPVRPLPVGARINAARYFSTRAAAVRRQLNPYTHTVRYEKRIGETKNAFIWGSARYAQASLACTRQAFPAVLLVDEI